MTDWYWTAFWAVTIVAMVVADVLAANNNTPGDTLTEHVRALSRHRWFRIALLAFLVWAVVHLLGPAGFV